MSLILLLFWFFILSFGLSKWDWVKHSGIKTKVVIGLFGLKVIAGFLLVYLYGHFYNPFHSDIYIYFNDALRLKGILLSDKSLFINILLDHDILGAGAYEKYTQLQYWDSSNTDFFIQEKRLVILINLLFSFLSMNNIYIHSMLMAFLGFIGQIGLFRFVKKQSDINPIWILIITFLLPTFTLWSASILKEPLIIFSLGLTLFFLGKWTKKWKIKYAFSFLAFFIIGLIVKPYVILALAFPILIFIWFKLKDKLSLKKQSLIVFSGLGSILILFQIFTFLGLNLFEKLSNKQAAFNKVITIAEETSTVGSKIQLANLEPHLNSFLVNSPKAFFNVLLSPCFSDYKNFLYLPDILQNLILILIVISLIKFRKKPSKKTLPFLWLSMLFVLILFVVIGLVTPVLGAIVRYKIPALVFVFFILLSFLEVSISSERFKTFLFHKKRIKR